MSIVFVFLSFAFLFARLLWIETANSRQLVEFLPDFFCLPKLPSVPEIAFCVPATGRAHALTRNNRVGSRQWTPSAAVIVAVYFVFGVIVVVGVGL